MLGIIGAMDVETSAVKAKVENKKTSEFAGIEFVCGKIENTDVCVAQCSPGKVNAALCAQLMIDRFSPDAIINIGVACSLNKNIVIKSVVVADEVCQYDFDTSPVDGIKGLVIDGMVKIPTDKALSDSIFAAAEQNGLTVHRGCIASGDTFIASQALKDGIVRDFGAVCGEMEGGAIGHVCHVNKIPFTVMRSISDGGDENAQLDYPTFKNIAADISTSVILTFIKKM